jgi:plasmid stabilization system protein ParE
MIFHVRELARARADIRDLATWLAERSPQGAASWLDAYDRLVARLGQNAESFGWAAENEDCEFEIRQALFKTRRGRVYREIFYIDGDTVNILRVRGPGQATVQPDEFR